MLSKGKIIILLSIILGIALSDCKYRKDCGGRRKKKVKTNMGGYM
jgi:hypothetical protein